MIEGAKDVQRRSSRCPALGRMKKKWSYLRTRWRLRVGRFKDCTFVDRIGTYLPLIYKRGFKDCTFVDRIGTYLPLIYKRVWLGDGVGVIGINYLILSLRHGYKLRAKLRPMSESQFSLFCLP